MNENKLGDRVLDCAFAVHRCLGPGLLESAYEKALTIEMRNCGLSVETQKKIPIVYKNITITDAFIADIVVEEKIIIELKSVKVLEPVHYKQLLTYLRLSDLKLGFLINFNEALLKDGIKRVINGSID